MDIWREEGIGDESLWIEYQQDFNGWKVKDFTKGDIDLVRSFRDYLRSWGVYVPYKKSPVIPHLIGLLREDEPVEWTEDTFQQLVKTGKIYSYRLKQRQ
jgi:hypothetical protein